MNLPPDFEQKIAQLRQPGLLRAVAAARNAELRAKGTAKVAAAAELRERYEQALVDCAGPVPPDPRGTALHDELRSYTEAILSTWPLTRLVALSQSWRVVGLPSIEGEAPAAYAHRLLHDELLGDQAAGLCLELLDKEARRVGPLEEALAAAQAARLEAEQQVARLGLLLVTSSPRPRQTTTDPAWSGVQDGDHQDGLHHPQESQRALPSDGDTGEGPRDGGEQDVPHQQPARSAAADEGGEQDDHQQPAQSAAADEGGEQDVHQQPARSAAADEGGEQSPDQPAGDRSPGEGDEDRPGVGSDIDPDGPRPGAGSDPDPDGPRPGEGGQGLAPDQPGGQPPPVPCLGRLHRIEDAVVPDGTGQPPEPRQPGEEEDVDPPGDEPRRALGEQEEAGARSFALTSERPGGAQESGAADPSMVPAGTCATPGCENRPKGKTRYCNTCRGRQGRERRDSSGNQLVHAGGAVAPLRRTRPRKD